MRRDVYLSGVERTFGEEEIIVTKTDLKGRITYANDVFLKIAGYEERDVIGAPHNIIRHPDMPHAVFKLLWNTVEAGREIFAYVINRAKNGDHYWVFAHVTPTFGSSGQIVGYHSNRRCPERAPIDVVAPVYREMCEIEARFPNVRDGMAASASRLGEVLTSLGKSYDELMFSI